MQGLTLDKQILVAINEILDKRRACALGFAIISMVIIAVGLNWPKKYESSTTLLRDQAEIVRPLLEGTAVTGSGLRQSEIASEVIYSNKNLDKLIEKAGLDFDEIGSQINKREVEILRSELRSRIQIDGEGSDILKISYQSSSPEEAFLVVSIASELFIEETTQKKKSGSYQAFKFIESQVDEYKKKLDVIDRRINEFKAGNVGIQVDSSLGVSNLLSDLDDQIRRTSMELKEATIQKESLIEQLMIESQKTTAEEVVNLQQERLAELEQQRNTLRLSYTETYPDIIQLNEQIKSLKDSMANERRNGRPAEPVNVESQTGMVQSDLYDRFKRQIADQETLIKTLQARKFDQERRLNQEIARSSDVNQLVSKLEELSRDRDVTTQLHDRLLIQRENARVSLSLEMENAGSLFKIQEPPIIPLVPKGLRFLHFAIASVTLGAGIPIGIVVGILLIDPRIRHEEGLELGDDISVIGSIPTFRTARETTNQRWITFQSVTIIILSLIGVVYLSLSRYFEVI